MPGNDIFGYKRNPKPQGVFSTENSMLTFGDTKDVTGYLVQNWNVSYAQNVIEVFELGSNALYWTKGRPIGNGSIARIVGFKDAIATNDGHFFPSTAYDLCDGGALLKLTAKGGHCDSAVEGSKLGKADKEVALVMDGCVITSIGFSASVADTRIVENVAWRFAYFEVNGSGSDSGTTSAQGE